MPDFYWPKTPRAPSVASGARSTVTRLNGSRGPGRMGYTISRSWDVTYRFPQALITIFNSEITGVGKNVIGMCTYVVNMRELQNGDI